MIRCAPAPSSEPTADSRIAVGNSTDKQMTNRRRSARMPARATNTGKANAARPEVAGTAKVVINRAAVRRCTSWRGVRARITTHAANLVISPVALTPAAMTNAPISNQMTFVPSVWTKSS